MALTLSMLLGDEIQKYDLRLIAGKKGMDNTVRWALTVEDREVPEFLHGNELVFTTGIGDLKSGGGRLLNFATSLKNRGAAGLVVNIGPYIGDVPGEVINYCNDNDFPIFTMPWKSRIIDITYDICMKILRNENSEVSLSSAFVNIVEKGETDKAAQESFNKAGFTETSPTRIMVLSFFQNGLDVTERIEQNNKSRLWKILVNSEYGAASFLFDGKIVTILQHMTDQKLDLVASLLDKSISPNVDYYIGVSSEKNGVLKLNSLYKEAVASEKTAKYEKKKLMLYKDIGLDKVLAEVTSQEVRKSFIGDAIGPILEYDKNFKTNYLHLLKLYLNNDCSVMSVSEQIGVHRNTVNYQIRQIKKILGRELDEKNKMSILLAIRMLELDAV